jgi:hypothetical protein
MLQPTLMIAGRYPYGLLASSCRNLIEASGRRTQCVEELQPRAGRNGRRPPALMALGPNNQTMTLGLPSHGC